MRQSGHPWRWEGVITSDLDELAVDHALQGKLRGKLTMHELLTAIRELSARGFSDGQIAQRTNTSRRTISRYRRDFGIPGLPIGTNACTRPQDQRAR